MFEIIDEVELKILEKFGFRPKYDENTGVIYKYVFKGTTIKLDKKIEPKIEYDSYYR